MAPSAKFAAQLLYIACGAAFGMMFGKVLVGRRLTNTDMLVEGVAVISAVIAFYVIMWR